MSVTFYEDPRMCRSLPRGALDSASRSIDQMIDQARFRHQHNGNVATGTVVRGNGVPHKPTAVNGATVPPPAKFKEAIDYLDQIFEDLRKECEDAAPPKGGDQRSHSLKVKNGVSNGSATIAGFGGRHQKQQQQQHSLLQQQNGNGVILKKNGSTVTEENGQNAGWTVVATNGKPASVQNGKADGGSHSTDSRRSNVSATWIAKAGAANGKPNAMPFSLSTRRKQQQHFVPEKQLSKDSSSAASVRKNAADVDVTETIVLPSGNGNATSAKRRSNRMDFTQKWLADDIKTWADGGVAPKGAENANDQPPGNSSSEDDDRSLGSCSAEVAAINAKERQRQKRPPQASSSKKAVESSVAFSKSVTTTYKASAKSAGVADKKPSLVVMETSTAGVATTASVQQPIRPQPYRPQPPAQYPFGSLGASSDYELHKVSSSDHMAGMMNRLGSSCGSEHRAASQDCSGSTHSHEGLLPTTMSGSSAFHSTNSLQRGSGGAGAFVSYTPQGGSIHSLPDAALTAPGGSSAAADVGKQPSGYGKTASNKPPHASSTSFQAELELDTLVAELELNTNPIGTSAADKRRSFPTTRTEVTASGGGGAKASTSSQPSTADSRRQRTQQQQRFDGSFTSGKSNNKVILGLSSGAGCRQSSITLAPVDQRRNSMERRGGGETTARQQSSLQRKKSQPVPTTKVDVGSALFSTTGRHTIHHHHNHNTSIKAKLERMSSTGAGAANAGNPFETINQERLKPSRVEAIQHMFEGGKPSSVGNKASSAAAPAWQRKLSTQLSGRDEPSTYCEIGDIEPLTAVASSANTAAGQPSERPKLRAVNVHPTGSATTADTNKVRFRSGAAATSNNGGSSGTRLNAAANAMPAFPTTQPPSTAPPQLKKAEAGLGKLTVVPPAGSGTSAKRLSSRSVGSSSGHGGATTIPSSTESVNGSGGGVVVTVDAEDDDDGFYDNIRESRFSSTLSELEDNASVCSLRPPTGATSTSSSSHKSGGGRQLIGQLIRRIGGVAGGGSNASLNHNDDASPPRPPMSAASLVSLNKVTNETAPLQRFALMKSNSLSNDRWKIANEGGGESGGGGIMAASSNSSNLDRDDKTGGGGVVSGFSNRLKQSIFGSKKRLTSQS